MANRNGLVVECELTKATDTAEREVALARIERSRKAASRTVRRARVTLGADMGLSVAVDFVLGLKEQNVTPRIAIYARTYASSKSRKTAVDGRSTRDKRYIISQRCRKRIEESFGWVKTIGGATSIRLGCFAKAHGFFTNRMIAYNLVKIPERFVEAV